MLISGLKYDVEKTFWTVNFATMVCSYFESGPGLPLLIANRNSLEISFLGEFLA